MGIKRFFKNKIKDRQFVKNRKKSRPNNFPLQSFADQHFQFPESTVPLVTIIIPVHNQLTYTLNCLHSLQLYDTDIPKEIIIIDDCSSDETPHILSKIEGIKLLTNKENQGFIRSVNLGIQTAIGKFIYLLNNDTEVQRHYLSSLLEVFKTRTDAGAVGSKIIFPNGKLQEGGCIIFENAEIIVRGRWESPEDPAVNFVRPVDYCSGCSLLFHRVNAEGKLNTFDEAYIPAYYEETDFCRQIKVKQGLQIYYQPKSEIIHYENISYQESNQVKKDLITKNAAIFSSKWKHTFTEPMYISKNGKKVLNEDFIYKGPSVLLLEESIPRFDMDSGSNRFREMVKILLKLNCKVYLASKHHFEDRDAAYVEDFQQMGVQVIYDFVTPQKKIVRDQNYVRRLAATVDAAWIFRPDGFEYWYPILQKGGFVGALIYDTVDLHFLRISREKVVEGEGSKLSKYEKRIIQAEKKALDVSNVIISISEKEKEQLIRMEYPAQRIHTVSNIHQFRKSASPKTFNERHGLLFIGGFSHTPNVDAVLYLHKSIMPLVWQQEPNIIVNIIGGSAGSDIQQISSERFRVLGYQEDVTEWFESSRVFVAPLRYGAGVKGKIGQALEYGLPIVSTPIGTEGMYLEQNNTVLEAPVDDPRLFAEQILKLYLDESLWQKLHSNSEQALHPFSPTYQEEQIRLLLKNTV